MIDYEGLHKQIKAKLRPDSPMPEGWEMLRSSHLRAEGVIAQRTKVLASAESKQVYYFGDFYWTPPASIKWFAEALGIPIINHPVPSLFFVVAHSSEENLEQITVGYENHQDAVKYQNSDFCKRRWENAFVVCTVKSENP